MKKATFIWAMFWTGVLAVTFGIERAFKHFGIQFHDIVHHWRSVLFLLAAFLGVGVVVLQQMQKAGRAYFVRLEFTGARRPAPGMELNLRAQNEDDARAQAKQAAEERLGRDGLMGSVFVTVVEVRRQ